MTELLEFIVKAIVRNPDDVKIETSNGEMGETVYTIHVADDDKGLVIGKQGRVINSIRTIARIKAMKDNVRINVRVE